jgi:Tfp pilus assembly ATPase PilU
MKAFGKMLPMRAEGDVKRMAYVIMNKEQRGEVGMVCRTIKSDIPEWSKLGLPEVLTKLVMEKNDLILFVGGTGSGKSTSLIDFRNRNSTGHIITIEDPVEFVHQHKNCIVNQREVGMDTVSYEEALKNTLRQAPDVILIGTPRVQELIKNGKVEEIKEVMETSDNVGMRTFDAALDYLYREGRISLEEALRNADSKNNLRLKITLAESDVTGELSLVPKEDKKHL